MYAVANFDFWFQQFHDNVGSRSGRMASSFELSLSDKIDAKYSQFKRINEAKYAIDSVSLRKIRRCLELARRALCYFFFQNF